MHRVLFPPNFAVKQGGTLGALAEKNTKRLGGKRDELIQQMANQRRGCASYKGKMPEGASEILPPKGRPWYRPESDSPDYSLNKMTPDQTKRFIMEGKKPIGLK